LRRRGDVNLIRKKWKAEGILFGMVERHKTILGVQDFFQRLMDAREQLVEVGRFIEGMHYFRDDLPLGFHPLQIGNVLIADNDPFDCGYLRTISRHGIEPAPATIFALKPAAAVKRAAAASRQFSEPFAKAGGVIRMKQGSDWTSDKIFGPMAENTGKTLARELDDAIRTQNCNEFTDRVQQRGELL
jgi:hypothetical protein